MSSRRSGQPAREASASAKPLSASSRRSARGAPGSVSTSDVENATRVTTAPVSSLSSLPSPSLSQPTETVVTLSAPTSARQLTYSPSRPPTKTCPVCLKPQSNLGQHLGKKACNQHLTSDQAKDVGYVRCTFTDCGKWVHEKRYPRHFENHIPASQVIDVPPRGHPPVQPSQPHVSTTPVSSPLSSPLSRSPTPSPARGTVVEQEVGESKEHVDVDSDVDSQATVPQSPVAASVSVGALLPESYQSWPHMFTYVPRKAQDLWTQACSQVLSEIRDVYLGRGVGSDVDQLILKFLSLPRLLLRRVAGQSHADKKLARTLFTYLRDKQVPHVPQQHNDSNKDTRSDSDRRVSAATRKVRQGHVRKAVDALTQPGMLEITIATLEQLQKLHPDASGPLSPDDIEFASKQAKTWLSSNDIAKRSERFYDNGSAPGPSGWTGAMLRPLLHSSMCRKGLATVFSLLMNGDIRDPQTRETLRAARLIPVPKGVDATGVRPIAVGELFARLSCVFAMSTVKLASVFDDGIQLGQGIRSGVERAVLTVQALLDRHVTEPTQVVLSTDVENAFNSTSRVRVMAALRSNPETAHLCRLFEWSHDGPSPLLVYNDRTLLKTLASQEGVQQGHVLGSLGYNMSIHPDYVAVQAEYKDQDVRLVAIHDDLTVVGPAEAAFAAFDMFASRLLARGDLRLRPDKCRVLIASTDASVVRDITALANTRGVAVVVGAMKLHGGCVGTDVAQMRNAIRESVSRFDKVLEAVSDPQMPSQIAWHIIRQCVVSGVGFFARITQPHIGHDTFVDFDRKVIKAITDTHSLPPGLGGDEDRKLLLAALGIAPSVSISPVAYLSCLLSCLPFLPTLSGEHSTYLALAAAHGKVASRSSPLDVSSRIPLSLNDTVRQFRAADANSVQLQRFVTSKLKVDARTRTRGRTDGMGVHMQAILHSTDTKHANLIFRLLPTDNELTMRSDDWDQLIRARLAYPPNDNLPSLCPHCRVELLSDFAKTHHHHSCTQMFQFRTQRHNAVLGVLLKLAKLAGYATSTTNQFWKHIPMSSELRVLKPDASIMPGTSRRRNLLVDVGITHPCAPTILRGSSKTPLHAASLMLKTKHEKYRGLAAVIGYGVVGLIMETYGAMAPEFRELVEQLVGDVMRNEQLSLAQAKQLQIHTFASLAVALHRGNGVQARLMFQPLSIEDNLRGTGLRPLPSLPVVGAT